MQKATLTLETSSSYLVHKGFSIQPYPFCTKSSLSNNKLSAISNISSLNKPFLAGMISDTADARLSHLFGDFVQSFNFSIYNGYISKNVPTVWLQNEAITMQRVLSLLHAYCKKTKKECQIFGVIVAGNIRSTELFHLVLPSQYNDLKEAYTRRSGKK